ncbi:hypothetical protein ACO0K3_03860 [Undibacterium sp. Rencai35W]|uniref:hypothetical protein n=1 Tax=Undibacterium sp. Rencai35W TaxID=3413046 RepID=UPI003BEFF2A3
MIVDRREEAAHVASVIRSNAIANAVRCKGSSYYYAEAFNVAEALQEGATDQDRARMASYLAQGKYAEVGKLVEQISIIYWTEFLDGITF